MKMQMVLTLVLGLAFLGCTVLGSSVKIDVTTQYQDGVIPNAFNIRCTSHPSIKECSVKAIISIQVTNNNGETIVNIQGADNISHSRIVESSITTEGHIDTDHSKTFLSVTISDAVAEDSGIYTCKLLYLDEWLQYQIVSASKNVTINNQNTQDIVRHLLSKVSFLENLVQFQGRQLESYMITANQTIEKHMRSLATELTVQKSDYNAKLLHQNTEFNTKLEEQRTRIETEVHDAMSVLSSRLNTQEHGLRLINARENTTVSFTALHTRTGVFQEGKHLIFSDVIENTGGAYNASSGVFTAVFNGYYMFHLSLVVHGGRYIEADLKTNTGKILARLAAGEPQWADFSDTGCVVRLNAGDRVTPSIRKVNNGDPLWERNSLRSLNKFTGFLLKATGEVESSKRARVASQLPSSE